MILYLRILPCIYVTKFVPPQSSDVEGVSVPTGPIPAEVHEPEVRPGICRARTPVAAPVAETGGQREPAPTSEPTMRPAGLDAASLHRHCVAAVGAVNLCFTSGI